MCWHFELNHNGKWLREGGFSRFTAFTTKTVGACDRGCAVCVRCVSVLSFPLLPVGKFTETTVLNSSNEPPYLPNLKIREATT